MIAFDYVSLECKVMKHGSPCLTVGSCKEGKLILPCLTHACLNWQREGEGEGEGERESH